MPTLTPLQKETLDVKQLLLFAKCPSCVKPVVWRHGRVVFRLHGSCCLWTFEAFPTDDRLLYFDVKTKKIRATKNLIVFCALPRKFVVNPDDAA